MDEPNQNTNNMRQLTPSSAFVANTSTVSRRIRSLMPTYNNNDSNTMPSKCKLFLDYHRNLIKQYYQKSRMEGNSILVIQLFTIVTYNKSIRFSFSSCCYSVVVLSLGFHNIERWRGFHYSKNYVADGHIWNCNVIIIEGWSYTNNLSDVCPYPRCYHTRDSRSHKKASKYMC